ncbi:Gx transporter family protein [Aristaeella hokkaidonensis]|uniref:Gx transporter family protein n=1 Tax=Aristaeella hokkaidonensis TaxID=3046382 RepID=A0AC61MXW3_9FIRM|nr:Gx transporter family protein [Aristaeella hokkaidonensis]QUC67747.1 Gx transporter family protein [Aristaeella hokkaidonensis]SNT92798.1 Heptaprenyl diphosphate synthase component I [Aristaeella hokkaidonensis]
MRPQTQKIARFGLLTALALVLGLMDRAIPVSALLGGVLPGIKLGLANTVLLYAVYLMDWKSCVALMLTKVVLSGFLFGSLSAILFSLSGGVLSLLVMLLLRKKPEAGAVATILLTAAAEIYLLSKNRNPQGEMLVTVILIGLAFIAGIVVLILTHQGIVTPVMGTSLAGAVTHNIGQVLMACLVMNNTRLLISYLPALIGIGAAVGCLTGVVTDRVLTALKLNSELRIHNS